VDFLVQTHDRPRKGEQGAENHNMRVLREAPGDVVVTLSWTRDEEASHDK